MPVWVVAPFPDGRADMSAATDSQRNGAAARRRSVRAVRQARQNREEGIDPHASLQLDENCGQSSHSSSSERRPKRRRLPQHRHLGSDGSTIAGSAEEPDEQNLNAHTSDADVLTVDEVASLLKMSVDSVRRIDFTALPHTGRRGAGRNALYLRENVLQYLRTVTMAEIEARSSNMNSEATENQIDRISDGVRRRPS